MMLVFLYFLTKDFLFVFSKVEEEPEVELDDSLVVLDKCKEKLTSLAFNFYLYLERIYGMIKVMA